MVRSLHPRHRHRPDPARHAPSYASDILDPDLGWPVTRRLYVHDQIEFIAEQDVPHLVVVLAGKRR
ncbi:hypothetical protein [Microlunatus speluncae]|uniref:hypothetical protein n=1 Tax=Microlunatus speluncae TaxID=2594267 RepID=UPI0014785B0B|nr:hypothetical protein [Microlunatus speluncae]